ncbi:uncharacterized protein LOC110838133 isoform X2 [Zootermopsis nevadensis]|nr:uncharacterized protein LOC110838133 isoform X2 [Zootermopsis nevadensis]XP_021936713.1 uncharacterized protein LOC110838133 isoform X2 [Zootermopsis nevadensis]
MGHLWLWLTIWVLQQCCEQTASMKTQDIGNLLFNQRDSLHKRILQQINSTNLNKGSSTWLPNASVTRHNNRYKFHNINAATARGKRETSNQPFHITVLYPEDNKNKAIRQKSSKSKRCQDNRKGSRKINYHHDYHKKGTNISNYMSEDDSINYHKSTYPSFIADNVNRNNGEFKTDNNGVQNAQLIAVPQAMDNSFDNNRPKSLASYIQQASKSQEILRDGNVLQQLLTVSNGCDIGNNGCNAGSNGLEKQLMNTEKEFKLNKYKSGRPSRDKTRYIDIKHQNEWSAKLNPQIYSHLMSDTSTNPSLLSDNVEEYYYPYERTKSMSHNPKGRNSPLKESMHSELTSPKNYLYKNENFPQPTKYQNHQYDNAQTSDPDLYGNTHENTYWNPEQENHQDEYTIYTNYSPMYHLLKHNTSPITNPELSTIDCESEHTVKKAIEINEDTGHKDMPLYLPSDDRRLMQGEFLSQDHNNSPHVQKPLSNKQKYLPGKSSEVLQEDEVSTQSISDGEAKETPIYYYEMPSMSSQKLKFSTSEDGTRLTTKNSVLSLPAANHNKIPSNAQIHTPSFQRDFNEISNNMTKQKLNNVIISTLHDLPVISHYSTDGNKIPSDELPYFNKMNEELQFMQNTEGTSPYSSKASTLTKELIRVGSMTDYPKYNYEHRDANTPPYTDKESIYFSSINGRETALKNMPLRTPTYHMTNPDECAPLSHKAATTPQYYQEILKPSNYINVGNVPFQSQSFTSRTQPQPQHHRQKNYKVTDSKKDIKDSVPEQNPCAVPATTPQIRDNFKYRYSAATSPNEAVSAILSVPEEINSVPNTVQSSVNDDNHLILQSESPEGVSPFNLPTYLGRVSERTKNEFLRIFKDNEYVPTSAVTSSEHAHLTSAPTNSINLESRRKSGDNFRETIKSPVNQYVSNIQASLAELYFAATHPPLESTITQKTLASGSHEIYPQTMSLNEYEREINMEQDVIPTLPSNEKTIYGTAKLINSEENNKDVSNSTMSPYKSNQISLEESLDFSEPTQYATDIMITEKEMKEMWNVQKKQSTRVMQNSQEMSRIEDAAVPITDVDHSVISSSIDELKIQLDSVPVNTTHQPNIKDVTHKQDTSYSTITIRELLTAIPYNHVSDVADMYVTTERQDEQMAIHSTSTMSNHKNANPGGSTVPDKRASAENKGYYYFPPATVSLPENISNTIHMNAKIPETLPTIQENISEHFYATTVRPQQTELQEISEKRELEIIKTTVPEKVINFTTKVSTYLKMDKPVTPRRASAHVRKQGIFGYATDNKSDVPLTVHGSSQNYEQQTDTQMDVHNAIKTKANENYTSPETFTADTSRETQETYLAGPQSPNKTDKYESKESELTTSQTVATSREIMNEMEVTNLPKRSNSSQNAYFAIPHETQDVKRITANLDKLINDTSWIQKDGSPHLNTDEYGTLQNAPFTKTPQQNHTKDKMRNAINVKSGFENVVPDRWNQNNVQDDPVTQLMNNTEMYQKSVTTSSNLHAEVDTGTLQENMVTNSYIQFHETKFGESTQQLPELQYKQDNVIFSEKSINGNKTSAKMNGHRDNSTLQHLIPETTEPFLTLDTLSSKDILHENMGDMIKKTLEDIVNSTDIVNKPQGKKLHQVHNTLQPSDSLQPLTYTTNSLPLMLSEDGINTNLTRTDYANGSEPQMDITTNQTLVMHHDKNQRHYSETAGLSTSKINTYEGSTDLENEMAQQRHTSKYHTQVEAYNNLSALKHNNFHSGNTQLPKEMQESNNKKQKERENTTQPENLYKNLHQENFKDANKDSNVKQDTKFETEDAKGYTHNHEVLPPNYRKVVPKYNTDSSASTLQIQTQSKNKEIYHSSFDHTVEAKYMSEDYNKISHAVTQYTSALHVQNTKHTAQSQQFGVETEETTTVQEVSERSRNIQNSDTTNVVKQSKDDVKITMGALEKTLMFLFQNKDKIKLLLNLPYSHTITSAPTTISTGRENQSHLTKQPANVDQGQTETMNSGFNEIIPAGLVTALNHESLKNILMSSIKPKETTYTPPSSLQGETGQTKSPQQIHTIKSECYRTSGISEEKHNLKNVETLQQSPILRNKYSYTNFLVPPLKVKIEVAYELDKKPKHEFELTADTGDSDNTSVTSVNLAYLPQKSNMRTEHSTYDENQSLFGGPTTDTRNVFDSPQLFKRFYMYDDKQSLQPELYNKKRSYNKEYIPEESYQQAIQNNIVVSRPRALGSQKYKRSSEEIIQSKPNAFKNYHKLYKHHSSDINNSEENTRALIFGFKNKERNKQGNDNDNGETMHDAIHMSMSNLLKKDFNKHNINYYKKLSPEEIQKISQNVYRYSNDCKYPINYKNSKQNDEIHKNSLLCLLQLNNMFRKPVDDNMQQLYSSSDKYETNENNYNTLVRRMRNTFQHMTTDSSDEENEVNPKYQSSSCQPYKCQGVLTSEMKIVTSVLKWLKNFVTGTRKT